VRIKLRIRRFFWVNPGCRARAFAEQVSGLTSRRSRRTPPLARTLTSIALALAGRAGAGEEQDAPDLQQAAAAAKRANHDALAGHVAESAKILTGRHGGQLEGWMEAVEADDQPDLHSFIRGIKRDDDACSTD
jgi:hypothetical protein